MNSVPVHIGLDYHSKRVQVCVVEATGKILLNCRCESTTAGVLRVIKGEWSVQAVAIESCCGAAEFGEQLRRETGWHVNLAHPGFVNRMKSNPDKSDFSDAKMLATLSRAGFLPRVWLAPEYIRDLRAMVKHRAAEVDRRKAIKLRILSLLRNRRITCPKGRAWTVAWRRWLELDAPLNEHCRWIINEMREELRHVEAKIDRVESQLKRMTADDPVVAKLISLKGVGLITASVMRAFIGNFDRFRTGKQLARFCAVTPRNASSGERVADAGMIKAGEVLLKTVVIQVAHSVCRFVPRWKAMCAKLVSRGKPKCVAIGAIANRWVRWLYHHMLQEVPTT